SEFAADCREFVSRSKRTVDSRLLAAYMRRMFERDYVREIKRIRKYQAGADAASLREERQRAMSSGSQEFDAETLSLAAGYERERREEQNESSDEIELQVEEISGSFSEPSGQIRLEESVSAEVEVEVEVVESKGPPPVGSEAVTQMRPGLGRSGFEDEVTDENPIPAPISFDEPTVQNFYPLPDSPTDVRGPRTTSRTVMPRKVFLTTRQIVVLVVMALAGAGVVSGTYYVAKTAPLSKLPK
ncbi:MAG: hypothetical protein AAFQ82_27965, partial [Myxococcota bacterium]